jgi:hypothetical protein
MPLEPRGIYRERKGWGDQDSARVKYHEHQELDVPEDRYAIVAISRHLINFHGKTTALTTIPRSHLASAVAMVAISP